MFGLIGKMICAPGTREAVIGLLLESTSDMPGCLSYTVARDVKDPNGVWITEVWDTAESHKASLSLPAVRQAIAKAKPMITGFESSVTTEVVGGYGLPRR